MQCSECGRHFVALGVHVRNKHGMDPDDYRRRHNIPLTQALADGDLRKRLSEKAILRMKTEEGIDNLRRLISCVDRHAQSGKKRDLPSISIQHCLRNNDRRSRAVRDECLPLLLPDWLIGMSCRDISIKHLVAMPTLRKWVREGFLPKRELRYQIAELKREKFKEPT
jgi:hypothetical protein